MNLALIHDDFMRMGGAEKVALSMHRIFPDAPLFTMCFDETLTYSGFDKGRIKTSIYQNVVHSEEMMKLLYYPFGYWSMRALRVSGFDKVLISSTYAAKCARIDPRSEIIHYCHNPFRLAWSPESYPDYAGHNGVKKWVFDFVVRKLRDIDYKFAKKCSRTIANSEVVKRRIESNYNIKVDAVINPPVNLQDFFASDGEKYGYLLVSRIEPYKKVDLVVKAFNQSGRKLTIVGNGSMLKRLRAESNENIVYKSKLTTRQIAEEYSSARALIFPQEEDFGLVPIEANASGTPVIAYSKGGVLETMRPYPLPDATSVFFNNQTVDELNTAICEFEEIEKTFSKDGLMRNAARFSSERFEKELKNFLEK